MDRILIIEDDSMMQSVLRDALEGAGFEVVVSGDGAAGIAQASAARPDLVLLDVNLPDRTGHDVCRALKSEAATKGVPVVMMTGEAREVVQRVAGLDAGADDYLFKPLSPKVLIARVKSLLSVRRQG